VGDGSTNSTTPVAPEVSKAIMDAYYPRVVALGDAARARAQSAYAIASAVTGVLVVAVITTKAELAGQVVRWAGLLALVLWLLAAAAYIRAVATPVEEPATTAVTTASQLTQAVMTAARKERGEVDGRQRTANMLALAALLATVVAFAALLFWPAEASQPRGTLRLSVAGLAAVKAVCPDATRSLPGQVVRSSIGTDFIVVNADSNICGGKPVQILVPKAQVEAVVLDR
jgi:hypothetical protein